MKITALLPCLFTLLAIPAVSAQTVNYSPAFFGPNANPVPEFGQATVTDRTTVRLSGDYHFGFGDQTANATLTVEMPLLPECVSLKVWASMLEHYRVTQDVYDLRQMQGGSLNGSANGDIYVQTRIRILKERRMAPAIVLNSTLKSASGTHFEQRRYFDTPGYYFDLEVGKSFALNNRMVSTIRVVADLGFLCWETTGSTQNDAPMYGGKIILSNALIDFENTLSGYYGWMNNGDAPLVYTTKLTFKQPKIHFFAQYQYGIHDFPYHHVQAGISVPFGKLTPKYN